MITDLTLRKIGHLTTFWSKRLWYLKNIIIFAVQKVDQLTAFLE